ncbi:hypothetical protein M4J06_004657 [Streptomyces coelicoflavus]|uniref:hypothetical protein n=1 Tax=Streptomyces coelicoflavus TaxID=285562 RepID=UPI00210B2AD5|nr:hypothetical protein [Streptomyces coelicoflavus]MCQ4200731.1 hypothetical protein [Streptomyces coelicoflavus]
MPDAAGETGEIVDVPGGAADDYRVVIGEECFDWRELADPGLLGEALAALAEVLQPLADGRTTAFVDAAYDAECLPSTKLIDALYSPGGGLSHDDRIRLQKLLDKCRVVEPVEADLPRPVRAADGLEREPSWGVAHALARAAGGRAMSVLLAPYVSRPDWPSGWLTLTRTTEEGYDEVRTHVLRCPADVPGFWRGVYTHERVPAERFFSFARDAFPRLLFANSLSLHHFKGAYDEVLPWLVRLLGALDDHFVQVLAECGGDQNQVMRRFKALGLDISPESPNTKKNAKAWEQRNVSHEGTTYRCEWHGKRRWDRDRVHFSLPIPEHDDRVLVGIFVGHLAT